VRFQLTTYRGEPLPVVIKWMNQESRSVLRTLTLEDVRPGVVSAWWDGRADNGIRAAPGGYLLRVQVMNALGEETTAEVVTALIY
jgi:flagellar hook assembly protein FlgD